MKSKMVEKKYTKIYFRLFPMERMLWDYLKILDDHKTIYVRCLQELAKSKENVIPTFWTFRTDHVFFNHTQKEIYDSVIPDVLNNISQGRDAIVLAYGQTGTGKSLTISGLENPYEDRGILPRMVSDLFRKVETETAKIHIKMCIKVSFVEFSRTNINDLLQPYPNMIHSLKEMTTARVKSADEALKIIFRGEGRKVYSEFASYPSHSCNSIFTFYIATKNLEMQDNSLTKCKLHVIDLAGADTAGNFSCLFKNHQEIGAANLAKTQLEQFFLVLCSDIPEHIKVKQRINPMIQYLGDSLNKNSILRLIGHIRASREDLLLTISMLRFGELIGGLKSTRFEINIDGEVNRERVDQLEKELAKIKLENKYNSILMHQDLAKSFNEERFAHVERTVNEYLQNKITQLTLLNVCDINIALEIMKMLCKKCEEEKDKIKEISQAKPKKLSSSSTTHKVHSKTSRGSNKTSSTDTMTKKHSEEKTRSSSAAANVKTSKDKVPPLQETGSRTRPKTSSSSLLRRSSAAKRKSHSSASIYEKTKSKSDEGVLMPQVPPEYAEAWGLYMSEKNEDYTRLVKLYEKNESGAKDVYKAYLNEIDKLREVTAKVEKHKNNLMMAKMTREFQQANKYSESGEIILSEFEKCCMKELESSKQEQLEMQELVLKCQAELKAHINICKEVKKELKNSFDEFCKEKYQMPVANLGAEEPIPMDIEKALNEEEEKVERVVMPDDNEARRYERLKHLIENEKRKKKLYLMRHREWLTY